jgi:hypothetical protein
MTDNPSGDIIRVRLRFYEELNDFLPPGRRKKEFGRILPETTTVKDLIEGCGVPHTEVDLILVNGDRSTRKPSCTVCVPSQKSTTTLSPSATAAGASTGAGPILSGWILKSARSLAFLDPL